MRKILEVLAAVVCAGILSFFGLFMLGRTIEAQVVCGFSDQPDLDLDYQITTGDGSKLYGREEQYQRLKAAGPGVAWRITYTRVPPWSKKAVIVRLEEFPPEQRSQPAECD